MFPQEFRNLDNFGTKTIYSQSSNDFPNDGGSWRICFASNISNRAFRLVPTKVDDFLQGRWRHFSRNQQILAKNPVEGFHQLSQDLASTVLRES